MIDASRLRQILEYDPETGVWRWQACHQRYGWPAGCRNKAGYLRIHVGGKLEYAHRLAFLYMTGEMPDQVDHIDGDRANNAWRNLRETDASRNAANAKLARNNKVGLKGVSWCQSANRYQASICCQKQQRHLGFFDSPEAAHAAYVVAANRLFGEFARAA